MPYVEGTIGFASKACRREAVLERQGWDQEAGACLPQEGSVLFHGPEIFGTFGNLRGSKTKIAYFF